MPSGKSLTLVEGLPKLRTQVSYLLPFIGGVWRWKRAGRMAMLQDAYLRWRWFRAAKLAAYLLREFPGSLEAQYLAAELYRIAYNLRIYGMTQASRDLYTRVLDAQPDNFLANYGLANLYLSMDEECYPLAEIHYRRAEKNRGANVIPDLYRNLGYVHTLQENTPEAIASFEKYLQAAPGDKEIVRTLNYLKAGEDVKILHYSRNDP